MAAIWYYLPSSFLSFFLSFVHSFVHSFITTLKTQVMIYTVQAKRLLPPLLWLRIESVWRFWLDVAAPELPTCSFARSFDIQKYTRCYSQELLNSEITTYYALLRRIARGLHRFNFNYTNHAWYENMATLARKARILSKHGRSPRRISDLRWPYYCRAVVTLEITSVDAGVIIKSLDFFVRGTTF